MLYKLTPDSVALNYVATAALSEPVVLCGALGHLTASNSTVGLRYAADPPTGNKIYLDQKNQIRIRIVHLHALHCCVPPLKSIPTISNHKGD